MIASSQFNSILKCHGLDYDNIDDVFEVESNDSNNLIISESNSMDTQSVSLIELNSYEEEENNDLDLFEEPNSSNKIVIVNNVNNNNDNINENNNVIENNDMSDSLELANLSPLSHSTVIDENVTKEKDPIIDIILNSIHIELKKNFNVERLIRNNLKSITDEAIELTFFSELKYPSIQEDYNTVNVIGIVDRYYFISNTEQHLFISDESKNNLLIRLCFFQDKNTNLFKCGDIVSIRNLKLQLNTQNVHYNICNSLDQIIV